ncbi:E3 ubiquitin-protein ligase MIB2 [Acropora cervicornis]|uniref:E3 ubiquitin-protein ligase MIB2 n=1 Tax=Acropora cervicornis TaxID=6130 RepID=A0AAD9UY86_ACRCE|nr:E3 ubiquitin-protein ligase MIB2 [Acropora cervicornis]
MFLTQAGLRANGRTPMKDGLLAALKEIVANGGVVNVNGRKLCPRIILMTDGKPTDDEGRETAGAVSEVLVAAVLFGARWQVVGLPHKIPIACVGCGNADKDLLEKIAEVTGGMYVMVQDMNELSTFFKRQVLLSRFIAKFAHDMAQLRSLMALQQFMRSLGENQPLMTLLLAMIVAEGDDDGDDSNEYPKPPPVGTRVRRGPHWQWGDQDGNGPGTVVKTGETAGPNWKWGNQDGGAGNIGRVFAVRNGVVEVRWPNGHTNTYRHGAEGAVDVLIHPADLVTMGGLGGPRGNPACQVM